MIARFVAALKVGSHQTITNDSFSTINFQLWWKHDSRILIINYRRISLTIIIKTFLYLPPVIVDHQRKPTYWNIDFMLVSYGSPHYNRNILY